MKKFLVPALGGLSFGLLMLLFNIFYAVEEDNFYETRNRETLDKLDYVWKPVVEPVQNALFDSLPPAWSNYGLLVFPLWAGLFALLSAILMSLTHRGAKRRD